MNALAEQNGRALAHADTDIQTHTRHIQRHKDTATQRHSDTETEKKKNLWPWTTSGSCPA
eukprot:2446785-Rhodomonas_salina.1